MRAVEMQVRRAAGQRYSIAMAAVFALAMIWALAPSPAAAAKKPVKVKILTTSQRTLTSSHKIQVAVGPGKTGKVKVAVTAIAGGKTTLLAHKTVSQSSTHLKKYGMFFADQGARSAVLTCITTHLKAKASIPTGKPRKLVNSSFRVKMQRDPKQCNGTRPVGVDFDNTEGCDFIGPAGQNCLFPYPNDFLTKPASTPTGRILNLKLAGMPANASNVRINPSEINTSDGFSPGAAMILRVPGLDTPQAFQNTNPPAITDMATYADASSPIVLIDAATGQRQPIWAELDANAAAPDKTDLLIHYSRNLLDGHRYIIALRNLKNAAGKTLPAPPGFRLYRDKIKTAFSQIESRRAHFESLFGKLRTAGIGRSNLYMAWDFTVASTTNITSRMIHIRDDALSQLGDTTPGDGVINGTAPAYNITNVTTGNFPVDTSTDPLHGDAVENVREVTGTFQVPCYIHPDCLPAAPGTFQYDSNGNPTQATGPGAMQTARFTCNIPRSAVTPSGPDPDDYTAATTDRPAMYGHGLFGDYTEVHTGDVRKLGNDHNVITCATDFVGMDEDDEIPEALPALVDLSKFTALPDRLQQGFVDFIYLGRLLAAPGGLASDDAFKFGGTSVLATDKGLFYYGNSQGGIAGGALTAVEPDITRTVLYVPGMDYSLLVTRSADFSDFSSILYPQYPDDSEHPLLLSLIQSMWDRGEPDGYANHITSDPLPGTPVHKVILEMAYGDHQVPNISTETEARTLGLSLRQPALDAARLPTGMTAANSFFDIPTLGDLGGAAANGSAMFVWDIGPKRGTSPILGTDPAPLTNTAPDDSFGVDPHDTVIRQTPEVRAQIAQFLQNGGTVTDPCGANPCYAAGWTGFP